MQNCQLHNGKMHPKILAPKSVFQKKTQKSQLFATVYLFGNILAQRKFYMFEISFKKDK
jgi:hypothetical protein